MINRINAAGVDGEGAVGAVAIVGAEGTESREELRALLASERARRQLAEGRLAASAPAPHRPLRRRWRPPPLLCISSRAAAPEPRNLA